MPPTDVCEPLEIGDAFPSPTLRPMLLEMPGMAPKEPQIVLTGMWGFISRSLGIPAWGQILCLATLALAGGALHIEMTLASINTKLDLMPAMLGRQLISDASRYAGRDETAALKATDNAIALIRLASNSRLKVPTDYFSETSSAIGSLAAASSGTGQLWDTAISARLVLAEYRSKIAPIPTDFGKTAATHEPLRVSESGTVDSRTWPAATLVSEMPPGTDFLITIDPIEKRLLSDNRFIDTIAFKNGEQTLDGFHWRNVVFVNTHIKYYGGEVELANVRFVQCTFQIVRDSHGSQMANYVAVLPSEPVVVGTRQTKPAAGL